MHVLTRTSTTRGPETEPFSTHNIIQLAFIWHNVGILLCKNGEPEQRREKKKRAICEWNGYHQEISMCLFLADRMLDVENPSCCLLISYSEEKKGFNWCSNHEIMPWKWAQAASRFNAFLLDNPSQVEGKIILRHLCAPFFFSLHVLGIIFTTFSR